MSSPTVLSDPRERAVAQRFEAKYFLDEVRMELVRDFVMTYTQVDRHQPVYPVTSMYLDSADFVTYRSSVHGEKNRYKLRVRSYEGDASKPVFAEVKQRIGRVIRKHRSRLDRSVVDRISWAEPVAEDLLVDPGQPGQRENLMLFSELCTRVGAEPRIGVRYIREAFDSALDEPVRITFDRDISFAPLPENLHDLWSESMAWRRLSGVSVVLEIKFTDRFPSWVHRMVQRFQLERISLAKYVICVEQLRREGGFWKSGERSLIA